MKKTIQSRRRARRASLSLLALCACQFSISTVQAQRLFLENFESVPLGPNVDEVVAGSAVWTKTPPAGWSVDDSKMPGVGVPSRDGVTEWAGWSFANRKWWVRADDQRRSEFVLADGAVMIADPDEWDDAAHEPGLFESIVTTGSIPISNAAANSLVMVYDSSWRPEAVDDGAPNFPVGPEGERINDQTGFITMSVNGAAATEIQRWTSISDAPTYHDHAPNETVVIPLNNAANVNNVVLKIGMEKAANDWWWAVDNIAIGTPPFVYAISPTGVGFTNRIIEALGRTVDQARPITVELDGSAVTPVTVSKEGDIVFVSYSQEPNVFVPGSRHSVKVKYTTNGGTAQEDTTEFVAPSYTTVSATINGLTASMRDEEWLTIDESKPMTFQLDGTNVTAVAGSLTRTDATVSARFSFAQPFAAKSQHTFKVVFSTVAGGTVEDTITFVSPDYGTIPGSLGTPLGSAAQPGLRWRTHHTETARPGSIAEAEAQLRGERGPSIHDTTGQNANGYFDVTVVNFEQTAGGAGNFSASAEAPQNVDDTTIPGVAEGGDNIAGEALAFIEIPQPGIYTMVVNSDDGFQLSVGTTNNPNQQVLGRWDAGRGATDSAVYFRADQAGVYLFRLLWFEATGGASVEWFSVNADGSRALIGGTQPGALKAFRVRTVAEPPASAEGPSLQVSRSGTGIKISWPVSAAGFQLETTDSLGGSWTAVAGTPVVEGPNNTVQVTTTARAAFYRLRKP